jgi:putative transposase
LVEIWIGCFGWLYEAAAIDLFSRRMMGWSKSAAITAQLLTTHW